MADLALGAQLGDGAHRVLERDRGVGAVQLVERHLVEAQPLEAAVERGAQVPRPAVGPPLAGAVAQQAALGGHDDVAVGRQYLGDQLFAHVGPVRVGGVDEVDAQLDRPAQHGDGRVVVGGRAPDAPPRDAHGPEAEAVDRQVAEGEAAGGCGGRVRSVVRHGRHRIGGPRRRHLVSRRFRRVGGGGDGTTAPDPDGSHHHGPTGAGLQSVSRGSSAGLAIAAGAGRVGHPRLD